MMTRRTWASDVASLLCALAATWPLRELVVDHTMRPATALVVAVVLVGIACRRLRVGALAGLAVQSVAGLVAGAFLMMLAHVPVSPSGVSALADGARAAVSRSVAPLAPSPGVLAMIALGAAFVALVIDFVGATARMPLLAALPVAAPFVLVSTALGDTLPALYFIVAALAWAFLALTQASTHQLLSRTTIARDVSSLTIFALMTIVAVLAGLLLPAHLPQRPTPALAEGAGRNVDTSVNFSDDLDLSKDLKSDNNAPVLVYRSDAKETAPLRVTTSSVYKDGAWRATARQGPFKEARANTELEAPGLSASTPTRTQRISVTTNGMKGPLAAAPAPLRAANFGKGNETFRMTANGDVPLISRDAPAYSVMYRELTAAARPSSETSTTTSTPSVTADDLDLSALPRAARSRITRLANDVTAGSGSRFEAAVELQRHFRTSSSYRYSLELAPTRTVDGAQLDPLSNFLDTGQGYCTQFATAMIMTARAKGIPARMAIGFLPGIPDGTDYKVVAADAHAWPELYFPGMGWTRFDPTPSARSGTAPAYAPDRAPRETASATPSSTPATSTTLTPTSTTSSTTPPARPATDTSFPVTAVLGTLAGLALIIVLLGILPLAGRMERRRLLSRARNEREHDEGHWHAMCWSLRDLGMPILADRSPRQIADAFAQDHAAARPHLAESLKRAAAAIEGTRYSPTTSRPIASSTERVVTAARDSAGWLTRLRAALLPRSGIEFFRRMTHQR